MTAGGRNRMLRRLLMAVMAMICLSVAAVYVGYRHFRRDPRVWVQAVPRQALMSMDRVHHTATRDGRTEWVLDAQQAKLDDGQKAVLSLTKPTVRFYPRQGGTVDLSAEKGRLYTASSDIEVQDRVVLHNDKYRLETERLRYDHARRRLLAPTPVRISSRENTISAAAMTVFIDQRRAELTGNVKGVFSGPMLW
jgi:LPS export ABC transporter protein LptC